MIGAGQTGINQQAMQRAGVRKAILASLFAVIAHGVEKQQHRVTRVGRRHRGTYSNCGVALPFARLA